MIHSVSALRNGLRNHTLTFTSQRSYNDLASLFNFRNFSLSFLSPSCIEFWMFHNSRLLDYSLLKAFWEIEPFFFLGKCMRRSSVSTIFIRIDNAYFNCARFFSRVSLRSMAVYDWCRLRNATLRASTLIWKVFLAVSGGVATIFTSTVCRSAKRLLRGGKNVEKSVFQQEP